MKKETDYLACFNLSYGAGSWARNEDINVAIKNCLNIAICDWQSTFKLDDTQMTIVVWDVSGYDDIAWGDGYIHGYVKGDDETQHDLKDKLVNIIKLQTPPLGRSKSMTTPTYKAKLKTAMDNAEVIEVSA